MDKFYIQWNIVNWITVVLMVAVGMTLVSAAAAVVKQYSTPAAAAS